MNEILLIVSIIIVVLVGFWKFYDSAKWVPVRAEILNCELTEIYNRPGTLKNQGSKTFEYKIDVEYRYEYRGQTKNGTTVYAGLPNIFSYKEDAEKILKEYEKGKIVVVFVNPGNPAESSLLTSKSVSKSGQVIMGVFIVVALILFGVGFFYAKKIFN